MKAKQNANYTSCVDAAGSSLFSHLRHSENRLRCNSCSPQGAPTHCENAPFLLKERVKQEVLSPLTWWAVCSRMRSLLSASQMQTLPSLDELTHRWLWAAWWQKEKPDTTSLWPVSSPKKKQNKEGMWRGLQLQVLSCKMFQLIKLSLIKHSFCFKPLPFRSTEISKNYMISNWGLRMPGVLFSTNIYLPPISIFHPRLL